jgi:hypothetical protein
MESVYIETSVVSYLVARPSRDPVTAWRQQLTNEWWVERCGLFQIVAAINDAGVEEGGRFQFGRARGRDALSVSALLRRDKLRVLADRQVSPTFDSSFLGHEWRLDKRCRSVNLPALPVASAKPATRRGKIKRRCSQMPRSFPPPSTTRRR